ncbi:YdcF family protein [Chakrabartyella piscis]|uniref:YdcF family protein n=1 Tax=Chakrabartyella piscis TaxID=2918914 RepID=UPI002958B398|nr:YdcF family protein [Chakrabartyella piscis]
MNPRKKHILYCISIILLLYGLGTAVFTLTATGSMVIIFFGLLFYFYTLFYNQIHILCQQKPWRYLYLFVKTGFYIFCITFLIHTITITKETLVQPEQEADAIIVLGAGLIGEDVSLSLASRLDTAAAYHQAHPNSVIVVSGGQGENEIVTEAYAMSKYLQNTYDIGSDSILLEEQSTRTTENFQYSKRILDEHFDGDYTAIFVTNDFHVYRSELLADLAGLEAEGISAPSPWYLLPNYYVREYFALIKYRLVDAPFWV